MPMFAEAVKCHLKVIKCSARNLIRMLIHPHNILIKKRSKIVENKRRIIQLNILIDMCIIEDAEACNIRDNSDWGAIDKCIDDMSEHDFDRYEHKMDAAEYSADL